MITPDMLRSIVLFASLDDAALQEIAVSAADIHLTANEWLVHEGETPAFFVLLSGDIEVTKIVGGAEQVITRYGSGDYFGEVPLLLGSTIIANLRALTDVRVLRLEGADFQALIARSEKLAAHIVQTLTRRVTHLQHLAFEAPANKTLIVGQPADLACHDLRQFLSGNHIPFRWLDPTDPAVHPLIPASVGDGPFPAIVLPDGEVLHNPSNREAAIRFGLQTAPQHPAYDVVIVGGGPAGLAAAVYGASEGLRALMIEREAPGGQAGTSSRIENYLGFPTGLSGDELGARALQQAKRFGTEIVVARDVRAIEVGSEVDPEVGSGTGYNGIFSIGHDKPCSLCGDFGSQFWIDIWDYPAIGVYFADCPSAGHDMLCLDYRECGPEGEPCVVHVDQEWDYKITFVAESFEAFIRGLEAAEAFEEEA